MEAQNTSGRIEIHGVLFKENLPEKIRHKINLKDKPFLLKQSLWWFCNIIYLKEGWEYVTN